MLLVSIALAAPFFVTDTPDIAHPGASCLGDPCSLRDAIQLANATPGPDDIVFVVPVAELASQAVITDAVQLLGSPSPFTMVVGGGSDRLLDVQAATSLSNLQLSGGAAPDGGCITASAPLALADSQLLDCEASGDGGAIFSTDAVELTRVGLVDNFAQHGGAVALRGGQLVAIAIHMADNTTDHLLGTGQGGAIYAHQGSFVDLSLSHIERNRADEGGGLAIAQDSEAWLDQVTLEANLASSGAALRVWSSDVTATNSTFSRHIGNGLGPYTDAAIRYDPADPIARFAGDHLTFYGTGYGIDPADLPPEFDAPPVDVPGGGDGGSICGVLSIGFSSAPGTGAPDLRMQNSLGAYECIGFGVVDPTGAPSDSVWTWSLDLLAFPANSAAHVGVTKLDHYGGATKTHALVGGATAEDATPCDSLFLDQRSAPRPSGAACDAGAYERQLPPTGQPGINGPTEPTPVIHPWWW